MVELQVTRLLQNPLGAIAPPGQRGDMVCVSDGRAKVYLDPVEFDQASEDELRALLTAARLDAKAARLQSPQAPNASISDTPSGRRAPTARSTAEHDSSKEPSLTAPRRAGRPASPLW